MPPGCTSSSVIRASNQIIWFKSTMMKSLIVSGQVKESRATWLRFNAFIRKNGHAFKELKIAKPFNYPVEKTRSKANDKSKNEEEEKDGENEEGLLSNMQTLLSNL